ncbi:restriction endonuclease [Halorussus gelatinilyticus]|uniref:Restriction endonuclease n=1 Tax=Halorussus gelatinilyticus TaxID=2937524 RepID=A0A8U0ILJ9_9EURY|nr:restriction endonuclease [Halorussus gelatinilyticus]UPW02013.1 restriction endonuclease [Halorussus gelatinilyticus]
MTTAAARERLRDRMLDLDPQEFEVLCKVVLGDELRTAGLAVTPASQDGGIDIEGRLDYDWFAADFGVQVKRYAPGNVVGNDRVHRLAGALVENGYALGTFVTTSSYSDPAKQTAEDLPIQLVSGADLASSMLRTGLGVTERDGDYELDATFWQDLHESDERVPAGEVPLGNDLGKVRAVLRAIRATGGTRDEVRRWIAANAGYDLSERHVYINANSATVLGLARKEPSAGDEATRWGLTATGAEYIRAQPGSVPARQTLRRAVRSVELVERVLAAAADAGELTKAEIDDLIAAETTGLSESSVERRGSAVRTWLELLPEIEVEGPRTAKAYVYDAERGDSSSPESF